MSIIIMYNNYEEYKINKNNYILHGGKNIDKIDTIINFFKKSKKEKIQKELFNLIKDNSYCQTILGEGAFGKVYVPEINKTFPFMIGDTNIELPIVIKESKINPKASQGLDILDKKLYITGVFNITTEALILMFIRKLWYKTVHLPLIFAYGTCLDDKTINKIVTLKFGLSNPVEINMTNKLYNSGPLWGRQIKEVIHTNINTLRELYIYLQCNRKDGYVQLPNGIKCNMSDLFDYICISYFATHHLLTENNILPLDLHPQNIFIHWLNEKSYYDNKNIINLQEIIYKVGKKYYKIKTFVFVIILGDCGVFNVLVKKDVIIVGQAMNIKENYKIVDMLLNPKLRNTDFIKYTYRFLTHNEYKNTIGCKIFSSEPYCSYPEYNLLGTELTYIKQLKSTVELLNFFDDKYGIDKYIKNKYNILIEIKKYN